MPTKPVIFLSAVSRELGSARQLVANSLTFVGCEPVWQDIFGTSQGDLRAMLRKRIDSSQGVVQLVGQCYGAEPTKPDEIFKRVSYTQYEALYARHRGKQVWYLFLDDTFPTDPHDSEPDELQALQIAYRERIRADAHVYHPLTSAEGLEASVLKLREDLDRLRRGVKRWAMIVLALLVVCAGLGGWIIRNQQKHALELHQQLAEMREILAKLPQQQTDELQAQPADAPESARRRAVDNLAKLHNLDPEKLGNLIPVYAKTIETAPASTNLERANAAYAVQDYPQAERLATDAAIDALHATPSSPLDVIKGYELAAYAALARSDYSRALIHLREAEKFTDRAHFPLEWARQQWNIAYILNLRGQHGDTAHIYREVVKEYERALGPEHRDTLSGRNNLALALDAMGKHVEATAEFRKLLPLLEKSLGPRHPETLETLNNFANTLLSQGAYAEAESELRKTLELRIEVLGPGHRSTLTSRNNLAWGLVQIGKSEEAERECREALARMQETLPSQDSLVLSTRDTLAEALRAQEKLVEAVAENRTVLEISERTLGAEYPGTLASHFHLAQCLKSLNNRAEAITHARLAVQGAIKVLGPDHPETKRYGAMLMELTTP